MDNAPARWYGQLYIQVLIGIVIGGAIGFFVPDLGAKLQPIADGFIKLIKMLLAPIIFGTVVVGIAKMGSVKEVGRIGAKALIYFEVLSTLALVIGLIVVNVLKPGVGMNVDISTINGSAITSYTQAAAAQGGIIQFFLDIIPTTLFDAFAKGAMLQVILVSVLMGIALVQLGETAKPLVSVIDMLLQCLFRIVAMVMRLAPLGAGAGMAFTIGKYGIGTLLSLGQLLIALYVTTLIFIVVVLGTVARWSGLPLLQFLRYFKDEILVTLGTCSTEAVLPRMMVKLEALGCEKSVVGLVLPTGYTFNSDGTCIYLTMAAIFVAQATNTPLSLMDQLVVLGVLLLTSKGSAGVAGAGFVTLAATLSVIHAIPLVGLVLLLGVDRFLNEARAVTNLIGNGIGTIAIAKWDGSFDQAKATRAIQAMNDNRLEAVLAEPKPTVQADTLI
ncbi:MULTISPECIES: C4-dicarboxylate transporter DctA [unclassified Pseudomonas]|uniref:C4-dicarboxylate transporter DctA n=1 Tax=unclassified Pseudomonas TaxID=196821 RepID=UPI002AC9AE54|nr:MULTISPECIES: C4-dicarboxylate transporter DctA [unclassified Pseudomonas]MEB0041321.1 C4-dicarboxylate transporter DctA [Pseudomonas sp. MH10]MEB0076275.1 C4-dicarboxylate transporter DctA [Pseudomonas sp. MH10out]MEB0090769.1 C4-dicarboxylate transporter DctA [Pseudomonas sp. CCI4.2]MEB0100552.1 C4-dicarboxylate transporter DctA [Pseudomonas sp. CCI3.2]MEB0121390.1 C4-dicarboxylate transporter DctA [Pseudomonas sp. CCI1.2]